MRLLPAALALLILSPDPARSETLKAGESRSHSVAAAPGDFIHGTFEGRGLRLHLVDGNGQSLRLLAKGERDTQEFMFVAGPRTPHTLKVETDQGGAYHLRLHRRIAKADQGITAAALSSPGLCALAAGGDVDDFWRQLRGPLVETEGVQPPLPAGQALLTFLWRGQHDTVWLFAAPSGNHDKMQRLGQSDVWFASYVVPTSTRLSYKIAPDVPELKLSAGERRRAILATAQRDPLNPRHFPDHVADIYDGESVVELPDAPRQDWVFRQPGIPAGTIERLRLSSPILGNQREIVLYRPAGYVPGAEGNGLLLLFDAEFYVDKADITALLDNLNHQRRIPSTAAIIVANPSTETRAAELPPNPAFLRFLDEELMPWAKGHGIAAAPPRTVVAGSSYGGLAAAQAGLTLPHWFGNVHSQSGSFWWAPSGAEPEWLTRQFAQRAKVPVRFHLEAGLFESGGKSILETTRHLRDVLMAKGYDVRHREYASGHDLAHWRSTLGTGLMDLIGYASPDSHSTSAVNR
ncbi:MAG: enterochelin [Rhodospirillaceae bacterium]|nr:MAG: enterochelin [Rhodospirillaceae bacterium]TNC97041.1 MAG: enterochelin esterase [Stygiobacter sp.]